MNARPRVVILDNYDSFAYNLFQLVGELTGEAARVWRNDAVTVAQVAAARPTHVIISPGPGDPQDVASFGVCGPVARALGPTTPVLGVCLGHQGIAAALGARVVRAPRVMHGKTSPVHHDGAGLFAGLPAPIEAMRYHSLMVDPATLPACLRVTAWTGDGVIMGLAHRRWPLVGVQFHPESVGTPQGGRVLANFLSMQARAEERACPDSTT